MATLSVAGSTRIRSPSTVADTSVAPVVGDDRERLHAVSCRLGPPDGDPNVGRVTPVAAADASRRADVAAASKVSQMASGSKKKNRNKKQQRKPQHHLPKVGTPADNAYLMKESRRDLVDFGMTHASARQGHRHDHRAWCWSFLALGVHRPAGLHGLTRAGWRAQSVVAMPPSTGRIAPVT